MSSRIRKPPTLSLFLFFLSSHTGPQGHHLSSSTFATRRRWERGHSGPLSTTHSLSATTNPFSPLLTTKQSQASHVLGPQSATHVPEFSHSHQNPAILARIDLLYKLRGQICAKTPTKIINLGARVSG